MKKVLWVCNIMLPIIAREMELPYSNREGWLTGLVSQILQQKDQLGIELGICFPVDNKSNEKRVIVKGMKCYGFYENLGQSYKYNKK